MGRVFCFLFTIGLSIDAMSGAPVQGPDRNLQIAAPITVFVGDTAQISATLFQGSYRVTPSKVEFYWSEDNQTWTMGSKCSGQLIPDINLGFSSAFAGGWPLLY